ncbi:hypothetical protein FNV43_RR24817 [Rhamnella rubrinervis]|uniref:dolichyl-phosphate beta-glucosyltransferase n=1 Tax=Rhamnella rubrinervis TaxID=2594499 RepID=A0A8K0DTB2_9ROSA|nr:hypothetical protein FNV43_RR24817 [Rhamnella rubrinervis]
MGTVNIWTIMEVLLAIVIILAFVLVSFIFFHAYRRRHNNTHVEAPAIFEDPNSLKQVPCPSIYDPAEKYISLIIPAFNEEHRLPGALEETMNYLQQRAAKDKSFTYEVVIVDDGSADGTKRVAFEFVRKYTVDNVRVILLGRNHGKGEAIRKGMLHSRGELLLMLDADGATKVTDLEKLENQIQTVARKEFKAGDSASSDSGSRVSDIPITAFGSRAHLEEKALATRKWYRNFLMKGFHLVVLLAAGPGIRDTQCGFKMFTRAAARRLFTNIRLKRWCFDVELVFLCKWFGIPMLEISVNWSEIPGSKVNPLSIPSMLWELVLMSVGYRTREQLNTFGYAIALYTFCSSKTSFCVNSKMGSPLFHEMKKQACFFFKEKIKTARLALTDVTPTELMTEEVINGNTWPPDTLAIGVISRAAFEVDDFWRIVEILRRRLMNFDRKQWQGSYKALILLERLLTHGPLSSAKEFEDIINDVIKSMDSFQYIDEKGFNWGSRVSKLSERVLKLVEDPMYLEQERTRSRNLTRGIEGFGSFTQRSSSSAEASLEDFPNKIYGRCNSHYNDQETMFFDSNDTSFFVENRFSKMQRTCNDKETEKPRKSTKKSNSWFSKNGDGFDLIEVHPFCDKKPQTAVSLLSSVD